MKLSAKQPMQRAVKAFRVAFTKVMTEAAQQISGVVVQVAGGDGAIQRAEGERIIEQAGRILRRVFVDAMGRTVSPEGIPYTPYARLLMTAIAWETQQIVGQHQRFLDEALPEDVKAWLRRNPRRVVELTRTEEIRRLYAHLRIVAVNPLAQYDPAHKWVDPKGYVLSERIWRVEAETRAKLNAMLRDEIAAGTGALQLSKKIEQFLIPGRARLRTNKPYGSDASADALRLARTELARAGNSAAHAASVSNAFVEGFEIARSANGDPDCPVCPEHATLGIGGERLREPYPITASNPAPMHPHCTCSYLSVVSATPHEVVEQLREMMRDADQVGLTPVVTPVDGDAFTRMLLDAAVFALLIEALAELGLKP